jgi:phosphotransferase system enzyme I (PtsI)
VARPADPELAPVLVGLGVTSLSMAQRAVAEVRARADRHTLADCRCVAELARGTDDAACAPALVRDDPPVR